ncbi:hypothetical protein [Leptospira borgpetersenii]|nr:hypothetical protein [Leptospira borgpetersenii]UVA66043.1 hypothetical protein LH336_17275 [Leptospira borgpetersenii]
MLASNPRFSSPEGAPFCLRGKTPQVMITAVSRELSGFLWAAMNLVA